LYLTGQGGQKEINPRPSGRLAIFDKLIYSGKWGNVRPFIIPK
jgi:hypothetical protein